MSLGRSVLGGTAWLLVARVLEVAIRALCLVYLARVLPLHEFGTVVLVLSLVAVLTIFGDLGISSATARRLAENDEGGRQTMVLAGLTAFPVVGAAVLATIFLTPALATFLDSSSLVHLRWLLAGLLLFNLANKFVSKIFEGTRRVAVSAKISTLVGWTPWVLAVMATRSFGATAEAVLFGQMLGVGLLAGVMAFRMVSSLPLRRPNAKETSLPQLVKYAIPMLATSAAYVGYLHGGVLLIQFFLGEREVAWYGAAVRLVDIFLVPAVAIGTSTAPFFVKAKRLGAEQAGKLFSFVFRSILLAYVPLAGVLLLLAKDLLPLAFGVEYLAAVPVLLIFLPFLILRALSTTSSLALDYLGLATQRTVAFVLSAVANILLSVWLIPRFGTTGAAVSTQVAYAPLAIWYVFRLGAQLEARLRHLVFPISSIILATFAALVATAGLHSLMGLHALIQLGFFGLIYLAFAILFRAITIQDVRSISHHYS